MSGRSASGSRLQKKGHPLLGVPHCPKLCLGHGHWKLGLPSPRLEVLQDAG